MKTLLISLSLTINIIALNAQSTVYGIQSDPTLNSDLFVSINPTTAAVTLIDTLTNVNNIIDGTCSLNGSDELFTFTATNTLVNSAEIKIYSIDINNGAIVSSPAVSAAVLELTYNKATGAYYALEYEDTATAVSTGPLSQVSYEYHLVSVNASTGIVTRINNIPGVNGVSTNNSIYSPTNEEFVFIGSDDVIYTIDVNTGNIVSNPSLSTTVSELQLNLKTGTFFAIEYDQLASTNYLVDVNPSTGIVTQIGSITGLDNFKSCTSSLDTLNNQYLISDNNDNFFSIDLGTANVISNPLLTSSVHNLSINIVSGGGERIGNFEYKETDADDINSEDYSANNYPETASNLENSNFAGEAFKAYPNPTTTNLTIGITQTPTLLRVFNLNGVLVETKTLTNKLTKIDVSDFQNGLYFFELSDSTKTETKKISIH